MKRIKLVKLCRYVPAAARIILSGEGFGLRRFLPSWLRKFLPSPDPSKKFRKLQSLMGRAVKEATSVHSHPSEDPGPAGEPHGLQIREDLSISLENNPHVPPGVRTRPVRFDDPPVPAVVIPMYSRLRDGKRDVRESPEDTFHVDFDKDGTPYPTRRTGRKPSP